MEIALGFLIAFVWVAIPYVAIKTTMGDFDLSIKKRKRK
jgi:hypothetical protein